MNECNCINYMKFTIASVLPVIYCIFNAMHFCAELLTWPIEYSSWYSQSDGVMRSTWPLQTQGWYNSVYRKLMNLYYSMFAISEISNTCMYFGVVVWYWPVYICPGRHQDSFTDINSNENATFSLFAILRFMYKDIKYVWLAAKYITHSNLATAKCL